MSRLNLVRIVRIVRRALRWRLHLLPRKQMHLMLDAWSKGGNVLAMQCGSGDVLANLTPGFVPYGIEHSPELADIAHAHYAFQGGGCVNGLSGEGLASFPDGYFVAVVMRSTLMKEQDPLGVLREAFRVLRPGGVVIVKVPNYGSLNRRIMGGKWCGFRPEHRHYFTPKRIQNLARQAGFQVHFGITHTLPTSDSMYAVLRRDDGKVRLSRSKCG